MRNEMNPEVRVDPSKYDEAINHRHLNYETRWRWITKKNQKNLKKVTPSFLKKNLHL